MEKQNGILEEYSDGLKEALNQSMRISQAEHDANVIADESESILYIARNEFLSQVEFRIEAQRAAERILKILKGWNVIVNAE
jgi:hypothetical protein